MAASLLPQGTAAAEEDFTYTCELPNAFGTYGGRD